MKKYNYSDALANVVKQFLTEDEWYYSFDEARGIFDFGLKIESKIQRIRYIIDVKEDEMVIYGICPIGVDHNDEKMMAQMAEFICRANFGMKNGCWEVDYRDGEIRYKSYIDCDNMLPSTQVIKNSIYCIETMYEHYAHGITSIIFAGNSAKRAIAMCEDPDKECSSTLPETGDDADSGNVADMIARLAERLGITSEKQTAASETASSEDAAEDTADVNVDLFGKKNAEGL